MLGHPCLLSVTSGLASTQAASAASPIRQPDGCKAAPSAREKRGYSGEREREGRGRGKNGGSPFLSYYYFKLTSTAVGIMTTYVFFLLKVYNNFTNNVTKQDYVIYVKLFLMFEIW